MKKIRVLHVMEERQFGGAFTFATTLVRGLDSNRFESTICMIGGNPHATKKKNYPCNFVHCRMNGIWDLRSIMKVKKVIQELKIDIVHTHLPRADVIGRTAAWLAKVPIIFTTIQALDKHRERWAKVPHALADRVTLRFATKIICCSEAVRQHLCRWDRNVADRAITIHYGIDFRRLVPKMNAEEAKRSFGLSVRKPVVGLTARLRPVKGVEYLLLAIKQLIARKIPVQCLIVGDGESKLELESMTSKLAIQEQVIFAGYRNDLVPALTAIDVFVLPSISEGLGMCMVEAMAMCKPIVATAVGGVPEVVIDGETGILVPAKDPERLADAIADLLAAPKRLQRMGEKGREVAFRRFDRQKMIQAYELLYEESIVGRKNTVN